MSRTFAPDLWSKESRQSNVAFSGRHSMDSPEWYTPSPLVEAARKTMGAIDLDPASHVEANEHVKAVRFFDIEDDGLKQEWHGRIFHNPPGGQVNEFWLKLLKEWRAMHIDQAIWIGYSLEQLQTLQQCGASHTPLNFATCFTSKRIAFIENKAKKAARIEKLLLKGEAPNATKRDKQIAASIRAGNEPPNSPSHSNYITYLGEERERFAENFSQFGQIK